MLIKKDFPLGKANKERPLALFLDPQKWIQKKSRVFLRVKMPSVTMSRE